MMGASADTVIKLCVPTTAQMMLVIRLTTAGVMARAGLTMDAMEDLKLAIEEACNCMMQNSGCGELQLIFTMSKETIGVNIKGIGSTIPVNLQKVDEDELEVIECILKSMVDEVCIFHAEDKLCTIEMTKRLLA